MVKTDYLTERLAASIIRQVLLVISYCHEKNIVHRDLKPENLLLETKPTSQTDTLSIKVIDFGTSALFDPNKKLS
jgi:calcium-dependent protein kinase